MKLIANTQLAGDYGRVNAGQVFEVPDAQGKELLRTGHVRVATPPAVAYETKVIVPQEAPQVSARQPFRHVPLPNEKPEALAPDSDRELPAADISEPGDADPGGRRGRPRPAATK